MYKRGCKILGQRVQKQLYYLYKILDIKQQKTQSLYKLVTLKANHYDSVLLEHGLISNQCKVE